MAVYLPPDWVAELEAIAADTGLSVSAVARQLLMEAIRREMGGG